MISLPWPARELHPNSRSHWAVKSRATKAARTQAYWLAHMGMTDLTEGPIAVRIVFHPPDKRRRDLDGMLSACKAYLDGIADAHAVDDNRFRLTIERGEPVKGGCVNITLGS